MWLNVQNDSLESNPHFIMLGKSLVLCQKFERTCLDIIKMMLLSKTVFDGKQETFSDEYLSYLDQLEKALLGNAIINFKKQYKLDVSDEDTKILNDAREARNFICHEAASEYPKFTLQDFKEKITHLALGDFLVSSWSLNYYERNQQVNKDIDQYLAEIHAWMFQ